MNANRPSPTMLARLTRAGAVLELLAGLASCVAPPQPPSRPVPAPRPVAPAPPPLSVASIDWRDAPATVGDWSWSDADGRSRARFGDGVLTVTCAQPGLVQLAIGNRSTLPTIRTTSLTRKLDQATLARPGGGGGASMLVTLTARDPLLDAMAFSRGRFALTFPTEPLLAIPSWPEFGRVIEDCR